jgi:hypothetical protein
MFDVGQAVFNAAADLDEFGAKAEPAPAFQRPTRNAEPSRKINLIEMLDVRHGFFPPWLKLLEAIISAIG